MGGCTGDGSGAHHPWMVDDPVSRGYTAAHPGELARATPATDAGDAVVDASRDAAQAPRDADGDAPSDASADVDGDAAPPPPPPPLPPTRFAVIGDYGVGPDVRIPPKTGEAAVAALVRSWSPEFIITAGDNDYANGTTNDIDLHVGRYYSPYIGNYQGLYGAGSPVNRFWPSVGNHDHQYGLNRYLDYFTLPGLERFYDVVVGRVHLFSVDSDPAELEGVTADSPQAEWLKRGLASSRSCFRVVYFHHPPYSSGPHGSSTYMRWPFKEWGATAVISGHDHTYERILVDGLTYFVNGLGGAGRYSIGAAVEGSVVRYDGDWGAQRVTASNDSITFEFLSVAGARVDTVTLPASCR